MNWQLDDIEFMRMAPLDITRAALPIPPKAIGSDPELLESTDHDTARAVSAQLLLASMGLDIAADVPPIVGLGYIDDKVVAGVIATWDIAGLFDGSWDAESSGDVLRILGIRVEHEVPIAIAHELLGACSHLAEILGCTSVEVYGALPDSISLLQEAGFSTMPTPASELAIPKAYAREVLPGALPIIGARLHILSSDDVSDY